MIYVSQFIMRFFKWFKKILHISNLRRMIANTDLVETENKVLDNSILSVKEKKPKIKKETKVKVPKEKKVKMTKDALYKEDQIKIANDILNILDPTGNNTFILYEIDNNYEIQKKLIDMVPEIKKKFSLRTVTIAISTKNLIKYKRPWLSILTSVCRKVNYTIIRKGYDVPIKKIENKELIITRSKKYTIILPTV